MRPIDTFSFLSEPKGAPKSWLVSLGECDREITPGETDFRILVSLAVAISPLALFSFGLCR